MSFSDCDTTEFQLEGRTAEEVDEKNDSLQIRGAVAAETNSKIRKETTTSPLALKRHLVFQKKSLSLLDFRFETDSNRNEISQKLPTEQEVPSGTSQGHFEWFLHETTS